MTFPVSNIFVLGPDWLLIPYCVEAVSVHRAATSAIPKSREWLLIS